MNPMELNPRQIVALYRTSMSEATNIDNPDPRYDIFQLKYDGWWVALRIAGETMQVITSGAEVRKVEKIHNVDLVQALLIGEWMYGTNWAGKHHPGKFFIHDIVCWDDCDDHPFNTYNGSEDIYEYRLRALEHLQHRMVGLTPLLQLMPTFYIPWLKNTWEQNPDFEGVVLKDSQARLGKDMDACKIKRTFTEEYVVMGISEGQGSFAGMMGALQGGQYVNGKLTPICSVGGGFTKKVRRQIWEDQERYMGKVFEAYGKARFDGGALRHPNFLRWRWDKLPEQCIRREL